MAKAATRTASKPTPKPAARPASSGGTKAGQAAARQGRAAPPPAEPKPQPAPPPQAQTVPAVRQNAPPPASAETLAAVPAFMRQDIDAGKENIGREDMEIPRMILVQGTHTDLLRDYNDLRPGHFFHPAAEYIFDEPFRGVVIHMDRRYILWRPLEDGGGILARSDDAVHWSPGSGEFTVKLDKKDGGHTVTWKMAKTVQQSGLANWGTMNPADSNSPPAATLMLNYLLAFPDYPDLLPAVLTFQRSGIREGRRFNTKIKTVRTPIFGSVWEFGAREAQNKNNQTYFEIGVKSAGLVEDEDLYNMYKSANQTYGQTGLSIKDIEGLQNDDPSGIDAGDGAPTAGSPNY